MSSLITLTTDFGPGPYVAAMKGVILGINPAATIVDLSHAVSPQNIREAALWLAQTVPHFPPDTIHVVVVDPGVGSDRRLLAVGMLGQTFLAPDNGVLSWVSRGAGLIERIELTEREFWRSPLSATFHGRDILAPVAAHLSRGTDASELGRPTNQWIELPWPQPVRTGQSVAGEILAIDHFGNLITNIRVDDLDAIDRTAPVRIGDRTIGPIQRTYADARIGDLLALVGSSGLVEIAERNGSAASRLNAGVGVAVSVG